MKEEIKQETLDICVIARFRDKEIAMKDLLKALLDENEKLRKALEEAQDFFNSKYYDMCDSNCEELNKLFDKALGSGENE